jgi:ribosomal protein S21
MTEMYHSEHLGKEVVYMIQVKRKERETAESLIRRFSRRVQQSGVLRRVRKLRFRQEEPSRDQRRNEALYKVKIRKEIDRLKKLGKFDEDALRDIKKKM